MRGRSLLALCLGASVVLPVAAEQDVTISGTLVQVSDEAYAEYHPRIDGDIVVFTGFSDGSQNIFFVDLGTSERTQVTTGPRDQRLQDVSDRRIVYSDYSQYSPEVFLYDIDTQLVGAVSNEEGTRDHPSIYGDKVAYLHTTSSRETSIRVLDLVAGQTISINSNGNPKRAPSIFGDFVAFEQTVAGDSLVYLHDLSDGSETALLPGGVNQRRPHVDGDRVVFDAFVDGRDVRDLLVYEISTGALHHIPAEGNQSYARMSGDWIGFDDDSLSASDIVLLHLPTGFTHRITDPANTDFFNDIDGNRVVFTSNAAGKFDIWLYDFEAVLPGDDDPGEDLPGIGEPLAVCDSIQMPMLGDPFFETTMVREAGAPQVESHLFDFTGPALVLVENDRCGAAWADLNGEPLLVPDDLNYELTCLWGVVELLGENSLEMSVRAKPGCSVTIALHAIPADEGSSTEGTFEMEILVPAMSCETGSGAAWIAAAMVLFGLIFASRRPRLVRVRRRRGGLRRS